MPLRLVFLIAFCAVQLTQVQAQILRSRVDETEASSIPFFDEDGNFIEGKTEVSGFFDQSTTVAPILRPLIRYEIYDPFPVFNDGANINGPVIVYEGGFYDQVSGYFSELRL